MTPAANTVDLGTRRMSFASWCRNAVVLIVGAGMYAGLSSGYFSPDRPTRAQWARLQAAANKPVDVVVYAGDLRGVAAGAVPGGAWGRYNGATDATTMFSAGGVKINYKDAAWLGAVFSLAKFETDRIYRITVEADVKGEPGAMLVRNRQMDLLREKLPVGRGAYTFHFVTPNGSRDVARVIFMPDGRSKPQGEMTVTALKLEAVRE